MAKLNIDEEKSLFEPIEFTLDGKNYKVEKVTEEMMDKATKVADAGKDEGKDELRVLAEQLAVFTGKNSKEFKTVDVRKLGIAIKFINDELVKGFEGTEKKVLKGKSKE